MLAPHALVPPFSKSLLEESIRDGVFHAIARLGSVGVQGTKDGAGLLEVALLVGGLGEDPHEPHRPAAVDQGVVAPGELAAEPLGDGRVGVGDGVAGGAVYAD